jgi:hypothetical protein
MISLCSTNWKASTCIRQHNETNKMANTHISKSDTNLWDLDSSLRDGLPQIIIFILLRVHGTQHGL